MRCTGRKPLSCTTTTGAVKDWKGEYGSQTGSSGGAGEMEIFGIGESRICIAWNR